LLINSIFGNLTNHLAITTAGIRKSVRSNNIFRFESAPNWIPIEKPRSQFRTLCLNFINWLRIWLKLMFGTQ